MKIATWNIERVTKPSKRHDLIVECLENLNADILVLTESIENIQLSISYKQVHTSKPNKPEYKPFERRVSILTKYEISKQINTFRSDTAVCTIVITPIGDLAIYGTVIGIHGNRRQSFKEDLEQQIQDYEKISTANNLCIIGDLNMSFSDNYYFTKEGRQKLTTIFNTLQLTNLTESIAENIDHIILPTHFIANKKIETQVWNRDKKLSDHIGVAVTIKT